MSTLKLYYNDSTLSSFDATVISIQPKNEFFLIELNQTAFYPEGGGQPSDVGYINDIPVIHVSENDNKIFHLIDRPLEIGTIIKGKINYEKRQRYTQLHSGEHIISGLIYRLYGYNNVGFHMDENVAVIDIDGELSQEEVSNIEILANKEIFANNKFCVLYPHKEELSNIEYRSKKELAGDVRLVYAGNADICACCGTHVDYSGEIGLIKLLSVQKHRGGMRISMTAGMAALEHYTCCYISLSDISKRLSSKLEESSQAVEKLQKDLAFEKTVASKAKHALLQNLASAYESTSESIICVQEDLTANELREYALLLSVKTSGFVLALSDNVDGYKYALTSKDFDVSNINKLLRDKLGAKGGGKKDLCQGNINADFDQILLAIKELEV